MNFNLVVTPQPGENQLKILRISCDDLDMTCECYVIGALC